MTARRILLSACALFAAVAPLRAQEEALTLEAALALARARSPTLVGAAATVRGATGQLAAARSLRRPRLSADAAHLRFDDAPAIVLEPIGRLSTIPQNTTLFRLGVTQPIYTGGRVTAAVSAAEWAGRVALAAQEQADVELTAAVAHAHNAALLAGALLEVAEEGTRVLRAAVDVSEEQHAAGVVARLDVLQAETRLALAEQEVRAATDAVILARERLAVVIGLDPGRAPNVKGRLDATEPVQDSAVVATLLARAAGARPDLQALAAGSQAARAEARMHTAALRPTVAVHLGALAMRPEPLTARETWTTDYVAGLLVSWPIHDFGRAAGEAEVARAHAQRLQAEAQQLGQGAMAELRAQLRSLQRAALEIDAARANIRRAEQALEIAQERYREGVGIQLEVLTTQADLARARAAWLQALHEHRFASIELRRAAGLPADASLTEQSKEGP